MTRRARSRAVIVGTLVGVLASSLAHASEPKTAPLEAPTREASAIDYAAPARCPDRGAFLVELRQRTKAFVEAPTAARTFVVRIEPRGAEAVHASLAFARGGRLGRPRTLDAKSCLEAVRALSFLAALVLDPDARPPVPDASSPSSPDPSSQAHSAPSPASESPGVDTRAPTTTAGSLDDAGADRPADPTAFVDGRPARAREGRREPRRLDVQWVAALSADGTGLAVDGPVVGGGVAIGARLGGRLELRASIHRTLGSSVAVASTTSSFTWTFGRLSACVDLLAVDRFAFGPCAALDVGSLSAEGGGVRRASSPSRFWGAAGLDAFARARVAGPAFVTLAAGPFAPLDRTAFGYEAAPGSTASAVTVYRPPSLGLRVGVGVGVAWP